MITFLNDTRVKTDESLIQILQRRGANSHAMLRKHIDFALRTGGATSDSWRKRKGFVYVLHFAFEDIYKIGLAVNVQKRMGTIGTIDAPIEMKVVHVIETDDMFVVEASLHQYFVDDRMGGEWFKLSNSQLSLIKSINMVNVHDKDANGDPYALIDYEKKPEPALPRWKPTG